MIKLEYVRGVVDSAIGTRGLFGVKNNPNQLYLARPFPNNCLVLIVRFVLLILLLGYYGPADKAVVP
jgi:hypothetical protein